MLSGHDNDFFAIGDILFMFDFEHNYRIIGDAVAYDLSIDENMI